MFKKPYEERTEDSRQLAMFEDDGRTHQEFKEESNATRMLERYQNGGAPPSINPKEPMFGDFTAGYELRETLERTRAAQEAFMRLPVKVRGYAENDPARFLDLLNDPSEREHLEELGLVFDDGTADEPEPPAPPSPAAPEAPSETDGEE